MRMPFVVGALTGVAALGGAALFVEREVAGAKVALEHPELVADKEKQAQKEEEKKGAVADFAEADYCTPQFKEVLRKVVSACGLSAEDTRRGCEPVDVHAFASISDADFNALFDPLLKRGGIVLFDDNSDKLDEEGQKLIESKWAERKGAKYFFVVARASKKGGAQLNEALSHRRANSVMMHLEETTKDKELSKKVGLLWLGSEYAQLKKDYCGTWEHTRPKKPCNDEAINRSAFVSWVDCRL